MGKIMSKIKEKHVIKRECLSQDHIVGLKVDNKRLLMISLKKENKRLVRQTLSKANMLK